MIKKRFMANHREIESLLIIVDNRAGGKIDKENRESPAEIGRVGMSVTGSNNINTQSYCQFHAFVIVSFYMLNKTISIQKHNYIDLLQ